MSLLEDPMAGDGRGEDRARLVVCPFCGYETDRKNNLKRHIQTMHEASSVELECCGQRFFNKADMRAHTRALHRNGYMCPVCRHVFCRKALLKRHLSVHTGIKDFICSVCGYDTSHKSNLERHMRTHTKPQEETGSARKEVTRIESRPTVGTEQAIRRGSLLTRAVPKALPDQRSKGAGGCRTRLPWAWVLPPRHHPSSPPLSPPPPPLLPCPAETRSQSARHPCSTKSFTIEALLQKDSKKAHPAPPSLGRLTGEQPDCNFPMAISFPACASTGVLRPTPIRPDVKDFSKQPMVSSIACQGRLLAVMDVTSPMAISFAPPPPPPLPLSPLCITPPHPSAVFPHDFMSSSFDPAHHAHISPPPLQCLKNHFPRAREPLGIPAFKETPPPESPERESSPEMVSSPEEHHHAAGQEYVHKKLRFSRKLRQSEVEQLCLDSQEMSRD